MFLSELQNLSNIKIVYFEKLSYLAEVVINNFVCFLQVSYANRSLFCVRLSEIRYFQTKFSWTRGKT